MNNQTDIELYENKIVIIIDDKEHNIFCKLIGVSFIRPNIIFIGNLIVGRNIINDTVLKFKYYWLKYEEHPPKNTNDIYDFRFFPRQIVNSVITYLSSNQNYNSEFSILKLLFLSQLSKNWWYQHVKLEKSKKSENSFHQNKETYLNPKTMLQKQTAIYMYNMLNDTNFQYLTYYTGKLDFCICLRINNLISNLINHQTNNQKSVYIMRWLDAGLVSFPSYHIPIIRELKALNIEEAIHSIYVNLKSCDEKYMKTISQLVLKRVSKPLILNKQKLEYLLKIYKMIIRKDDINNINTIICTTFRNSIENMIRNNIKIKDIFIDRKIKLFITKIYGESNLTSLQARLEFKFGI